MAVAGSLCTAEKLVLHYNKKEKSCNTHATMKPSDGGERGKAEGAGKTKVAKAGLIDDLRRHRRVRC